jgi:hypothetical protein
MMVKDFDYLLKFPNTQVYPVGLNAATVNSLIFSSLV